MNNMEAVVAILAAHREARQWTDEAAAADIVAQLGLDPAADAKNARPVVMPGITEDEVVAHETAAKEAVAKAEAARAALKAQNADEPDTETRRLAAARRLDLPPSATQAQIDAEEVNRRTGPAGSDTRVTGATAAAQQQAAAEKARVDGEKAQAARDEAARVERARVETARQSEPHVMPMAEPGMQHPEPIPQHP